MNYIAIFSIGILLVFSSCIENQSLPNPGTTVYISTFTAPDAHGQEVEDAIYVLTLDSLTGNLKIQDSISDVNDPSYFALHPDRDLLFVAERPLVKGEPGQLSSYRLTTTGAVRLNAVSAQGPNPCYVSVDASGRFVLVANYNETIASFAIEDDGRLSEAISVKQHQKLTPTRPRQEMAHPHMIHPLVDNVILVTDLGSDSLFHYQLSQEGLLHLLTRTATTAGAGPRHFIVHPNSKWCYVVNELNRTVAVFQITAPQLPLERLQVIPTLSQDDEQVTAAAIRIHPSGRYLYTSNRGQKGSSTNSISVFKIDPQTGILSLIEEVDTQGRIPRDFNVSPDGRFLLVANRKSDSIVVFQIDVETGLLRRTDMAVQLPEPVCINF